MSTFNLEDKVCIDCFATAETARFDLFISDWDPGQWQEFGQDGVVLWCNPPFSLWPSVTQAVMLRYVDCVCIVPDWNQWWVKQLKDEARKLIYFPVGTKVFDHCQPLRWGCWALHIEAKVCKGKTKSWKRRRRKNNWKKQEVSSERGRVPWPPLSLPPLLCVADFP